GSAGGDGDEEQVPGAPLDEGADRGAVPGAHDAVTLPVPDLDAISYLRGPVGDHGHRGQPTPPLQALDPAPAPSTAPFRRSDDRDIRVVDRLVDRLRAQPPPRLIREALAQLVGNLLRTPPLAQQLRHLGAKVGIGNQPPRARPREPFNRNPLRSMRKISAGLISVATQLPTDRRRRPAD